MRSINSWNLNPGILKLFPWSIDSVFAVANQSSTQVWILFHGLAQKYWRPKIIFAIAGSIGTPICINSSLNKPSFDRDFGHFVRVLMDIDLERDLTYKILVERVGFAFFVEIEYEKIPSYCNFSKFIGHNRDSCKRRLAVEHKHEGRKQNTNIGNSQEQPRDSHKQQSPGVQRNKVPSETYPS